MIIFSISEGIKGLFKARMATFISIISISLTIFLLGLYILFNLNINYMISSIRKKVGIEVFIKSSTAEEKITELKKRIETIPGIHSLVYITKNQAAERFQKEFGQDIYELFDYNPLPPSFIITLQQEYRTYDRISRISSRIERFPEVDEVVYQKLLVASIDRYINLVVIAAIIIGIIITLIAIALIYNTIRLTIFARKEIIHIMRLVGATEGFIKRPFIIEGIVQGFTGSLFASVLIYYGIKLMKTFLYPFIIDDYRIFIALLFFGIFIGMISAYFSVQKYLKRI